MNQQEAAKVVAMLMAAYPNARVPDGTVALYETMLLEFDRDRCVQAVRTIIRSSKFMPTIAEIVTAYQGEKPNDGEPYHQRFLPPRRSQCMRPSELAAAVNDFLAKGKPKEPAA